jgi:hypothetical protein
MLDNGEAILCKILFLEVLHIGVRIFHFYFLGTEIRAWIMDRRLVTSL